MNKLLIAAALLASTPAIAQQPACGDYAEAVEHLNKEYGEVLVWQALSGRGPILQIFQSVEGTWTVLAVMPSGQACVMDAGEGAETVASKPAGRDARRED